MSAARPARRNSISELDVINTIKASQESRRRRGQLTELEAANGHLQSEVTVEEAEEMLTLVQNVSEKFRGFSEEEVSVLAEHLSVMKYDEAQTIVEKGEHGTWFGILLSGILGVELPGGVVIPLHAGAIIGEMVVYNRASVRAATLRGQHPGLIATLLVSELPGLLGSHPAVGAKLMRILGGSALHKQLDNIQRRHMTFAPPLPWQPSTESPPGKALLAEVLRVKGLDEALVDRVCELASYASFEGGGAVLLAQQQQWPHLLLVLRGSVMLARWRVELGEGAAVNAPEFFGEGLLRDTSSVVGVQPGMVAALPTDALHELIGSPEAAQHALSIHKLLQFLGEWAALLCDGTARVLSAPPGDAQAAALEPVRIEMKPQDEGEGSGAGVGAAPKSGLRGWDLAKACAAARAAPVRRSPPPLLPSCPRALVAPPAPPPPRPCSRRAWHRPPHPRATSSHARWPPQALRTPQTPPRPPAAPSRLRLDVTCARASAHRVACAGGDVLHAEDAACEARGAAAGEGARGGPAHDTEGQALGTDVQDTARGRTAEARGEGCGDR